MKHEHPTKVLIVTGSLLPSGKASLVQAIKHQVGAFLAADGAWLDLQSKLQIIESLAAQQSFMGSRHFKNASYAETARRYLSEKGNFQTMDLTAITLASLLRKEGFAFGLATYAELYSNASRRRKLLDQYPVIFASNTLLRDSAELSTMMALLKRPNNTLISGGALGAMLCRSWAGSKHIDLLAVGYGEMLVPQLAQWIRSGFSQLEPPPLGKIESRSGTPIIYSGTPEGRSLDFLPTPDWKLAGHHGRCSEMVYYESVRGCPFSCAFCNYPRLFEETTFRYKSAQRIADDWCLYASEGAEIVTALDSLFTIPKKRFRELCTLLIERGQPIRWICYARADDLADLEVCRQMKAAGCIQVQIGLESGSQQILDNMNKRCTVEKNRQALVNCRTVGLTTVTTIMIGFPGETAETVEASYRLLKAAPPDIYYAAAFNTRFENAPILDAEMARGFGLVSVRGGRSSAPYWKHQTMNSSEVSRWTRWFNQKMASEEIALDGGLFYGGLLKYDVNLREDLLRFQRDYHLHQGNIRRAFARLDRWVQRKLDADHERLLGVA